MYLKSTPVHLHKKVTIRFLSAKKWKRDLRAFQSKRHVTMCPYVFGIILSIKF